MALTTACTVSVSITNPLSDDEAARSRSWCVGKENKPGMPGRSTIGSPGFSRLPDPVPTTVESASLLKHFAMRGPDKRLEIQESKSVTVLD